MDRSAEYRDLTAGLDDIPPALEFVVPRAMARAKSRRRFRRFFAVPVSGLVSFFAVFVILVNVSMPFAQACGRIPLLRELAAAVAFSPSLSAAVENEYVQPMDLEQTENGVTMRVEYVIVDQKQLSVFYTLHSPAYENLSVIPDIRSSDGSGLPGHSLSSGGYSAPGDELRRFTIDFVDGDMPDSLRLDCEIQARPAAEQKPAVPVRDAMAGNEEPAPVETAAEFSFVLTFDPAFTQQGETIELNQPFLLDGQRLTAVSVEIYPTHARLNLADGEGNTAWLKSLEFYLTDEKGRRFEPVGNGITATGSTDSPMMRSHRLESSFFSDSGHLTLIITGASFLDKDMERIPVDLVNGTADRLPEGVTLRDAAKTQNGWRLAFTAPQKKENAAYQLFGSEYFDEEGRKYENNSWMTGSSGYWDENAQRHVETPGEFAEQFTLEDYFEDTVWLSPIRSRSVTLESPVEIVVK